MEKIIVKSINNDKENPTIETVVKKGTTGIEIYLAIVELIEVLLNEDCFTFPGKTKSDAKKFFKRLETRYFEENKEKFE